MSLNLPFRPCCLSRGRVSPVLLVLMLLVLALAAFLVLRGEALAVLRVEQGALRQSVVASGRVRTPQRTELSSQISGLVREVLVREGAQLAPGQILIRLDEREAQAALAQARATLDQARARLRQLREQGLPAAEQSLRQAAAHALQAERQLQRTRELMARGFYSQSQLDEAQRAREVADSQLQVARLQRAGLQPDGSEIELAQRGLEQAQASLALAEVKLSHAHLRASSAATVLTRQVEPGDTVQPGRTLLTLAPVAATELTVQIDERNLGLLRIGQPALASADAYPGENFAATVSHIAPAVDALRGSVEVRLQVPDPPAYLKNEMTVSVDIEVAHRPDARIVPASCLRDDDGTWVMVVRDGRSERVAVRTGIRGRDRVELLEGPAVGEALLPASSKLPAGRAVRIRSE